MSKKTINCRGVFYFERDGKMTEAAGVDWNTGEPFITLQEKAGNPVLFGGCKDTGFLKIRIEPINKQQELKSKPEKRKSEIIELLTVYKKKQFIYEWNELRKEYLGEPSNLQSIGEYEDGRQLPHQIKHQSHVARNFHDLALIYQPSEFRVAMQGLFKQKTVPNNNLCIQGCPNHFFRFFELYLILAKDNNFTFYGDPE